MTARSVVTAVLVLAAGCSQESRPEARFVPGVGSVLVEKVVDNEVGRRRLLTVGRADGDDAALLRDLEVRTTEDGWKPTKCITPAERCFRGRGLFLAMVDRASVEADTRSRQSQLAGYPDAYPSDRQQPAEVFVIVEPGPPEPTQPAR